MPELARNSLPSSPSAVDPSGSAFWYAATRFSAGSVFTDSESELGVAESISYVHEVCVAETQAVSSASLGSAIEAAECNVHQESPLASKDSEASLKKEASPVEKQNLRSDLTATSCRLEGRTPLIAPYRQGESPPDFSHRLDRTLKPVLAAAQAASRQRREAMGLTRPTGTSPEFKPSIALKERFKAVREQRRKVVR